MVMDNMDPRNDTERPFQKGWEKQKPTPRT